MKVIAVLNQKGGSTKTTLATHITRCLQLMGYNVVLVDSDPQGTARDWAAVDPNQPVTVFGIDRPTIERDIKHLSRMDFVIIDGAPLVSELAVSAIKAADYILIPVQPSPFDVWATSDLVDLVKARIDITDGKLKAGFVVSRMVKGSKIAGVVIKALNEYGLPLLETRITQHVSYPTVAGFGSTHADMEPKSEAAAEVRALVDEIISKLI